MERLSKKAELSVVECRNLDLSSFKLFTVSSLTYFLLQNHFTMFRKIAVNMKYIGIFFSFPRIFFIYFNEGCLPLTNSLIIFGRNVFQMRYPIDLNICQFYMLLYCIVS